VGKKACFQWMISDMLGLLGRLGPITDTHTIPGCLGKEKNDGLFFSFFIFFCLLVDSYRQSFVIDSSTPAPAGR
jgi:hypothetical protein